MTAEQRKQKMLLAFGQKKDFSLLPKRSSHAKDIVQRSLVGHPPATQPQYPISDPRPASANKYMWNELNPAYLQGIVDLYSQHRDFSLVKKWRVWEINLEQCLRQKGYSDVIFWNFIEAVDEIDAFGIKTGRKVKMRFRGIRAKFPVAIKTYRVEYARYPIPAHRKLGRKHDKIAASQKKCPNCGEHI